MTTIISRLYNDTATAEAVVAALRAEGFPDDTLNLISGGDASAPDRMAEARVGAASAAAYAGKLSAGKALVVVRAPFNPIGAARLAMQTVNRFHPVAVAGAVPDDYVEEPLSDDLILSVLPGSPLMLSPDLSSASRRSYGLVSDAFGIRLLSPRRPHRSAIRGGAYMSTKFLPFPLLTRQRPHNSAIKGGGTLFSTLLGLPLVSRRR